MISILSRRCRKRILLYFITVVLTIFSLTTCQGAIDLYIGTLSGPETELMKFVKRAAVQKHGMRIKIVEFKDESSLNMALDEGTLNANLFQYRAHLNSDLKVHHYCLSTIGETFIYPMGIYSDTLTHLKEVQKGFVVAIPREPAHQDRALHLLASAQLIKLKPDIKGLVKIDSIHENPYQLQFKTVTITELPKMLSEVNLATIQAYDAWLAALSPVDALFQEKPNKAYTHLIVTHSRLQQKENLRKFVDLFKEETIFVHAQKIFNHQIYRAI